METTEKQKELCDYIIGQATFWRDSNDINSPTHYCDNYESIFNLELSDEDSEELANLMDNLLDFIKKNKRYEIKICKIIE